MTFPSKDPLSRTYASAARLTSRRQPARAPSTSSTCQETAIEREEPVRVSLDKGGLACSRELGCEW